MQGNQYRYPYQFFETVVSITDAETANSNGAKYYRFSKYDPKTGQPLIQEKAEKLKSKYGYTFHAISDSQFGKYRIMGGETIILDVGTKEKLAVFRGFVKLPPEYDVCPKGDTTKTYPYSLDKFVAKVLKPILSSCRSGSDRRNALN